jgi:hypothetical protein
MNEKNDFELVRRPSSAVEKTAPGAKRILSGMVADALALRKDASTLAKNFRIGDYEWCEPDYRQIIFWAKSLNLNPSEMVRRLQNGKRNQGEYIYEKTEFDKGRLLKIHWDFDLLPLKNIEWVDGLIMAHLSFYFDGSPDNYTDRSLNLNLPNLTHLHCSSLSANHLELSLVPNLKEFNCFGNNLKELDLSKNPRLTTLNCSCNALEHLILPQSSELVSLFCTNNKLSSLDLSRALNLTELLCDSNKLLSLDLSGVPNLKSLSCTGNEITKLDLSVAPLLETLICYSNLIEILDVRSLRHLKTCYFENLFDEPDITRVIPRLIQRPDQHF